MYNVQYLNFYHFIFNACLLPPCTWYNRRVTLDAQKLPPWVVKAASIIMHSSLLSSHLYHAQSSLLALHDIPLLFNVLFTSPIHHSALPPKSLVTPILLRASSFLTRSIPVTPHILLRHHIYIKFNLSSLLLPYFLFQSHRMQWAQLLLYTTFFM